MRSVELPNFIQHIGAQGVTTATESSVQREQLTRHLNAFLECQRFKDVATNGLQVAGRERIANIVVGVTANKALIDAAIEAKADAVIVHHGLFWKGDSPALVGYHRERVAALLAHNINLYAYHLPLDVHAEVGNNACLGRRLGLSPTGTCGDMAGWTWCWVCSSIDTPSCRRPRTDGCS